MESGLIGISQLMTLLGVVGTDNSYTSDQGSRLNRPMIGPMKDYWDGHNDWLTVDLIIPHVVVAIVTQGTSTGGCESEISVWYSLDLHDWTSYNSDETLTTVEVSSAANTISY